MSKHHHGHHTHDSSRHNHPAFQAGYDGTLQAPVQTMADLPPDAKKGDVRLVMVGQTVAEFDGAAWNCLGSATVDKGTPPPAAAAPPKTETAPAAPAASPEVIAPPAEPPLAPPLAAPPAAPPPAAPPPAAPPAPDTAPAPLENSPPHVFPVSSRAPAGTI